MSIIADISDYYTLTGVLDVHSEAQFSINNRDQWKELGIDAEYLYYEPPFKGPDVHMTPMMMSVLLIDPRSRHGKLI